MEIKELVQKWFEIWTSGGVQELPLTEDFTHISPYGTIESKAQYLRIVNNSKEMFLGNRFEIHDAVYDNDKACIRYTMYSRSGSLKVSEWIYAKEGLISKIVSYYNLQEEKEAGRGITISE